MPEDLVSLVLPAILIGIIGLVVGGIAGFLLAGLQNPNSSEEINRPKNVAETMRVWKDRRTGVVMVETGKKLYQSVGYLSVRQRQELMKSADELRLWLRMEDIDQRIPSTVTAPAPVQSQTTIPAPTIDKLDVVLPLPVQAKPESLPQSDEMVIEMLRASVNEPAVTPPSMEIGDILARAITPDKSHIAEAPKSIAGQVDEIVQDRILESEFKDRSIRVLDHPKIGLLVLVDGQKFEGIGDVTDDGVRQFLRECVAIWEKRGG